LNLPPIPGLQLARTRSWNGRIPAEGESVNLGQAEGPEGIFEVTLPVAAQLARVYSGDPRIVHLARTVSHSCPDEDRACVIVKIHEYVSARVRYQDDPEGMTFSKEFMYTPLKALKIIAENKHFRGDCEEIACLTATMLTAAGVPCGFVIGERNHQGGVLFHVWVLGQGDYAGNRWIHSDPTHHVPAGKTAGRFEQYYFMPI
jgi:transglutaminase-like putative cysteine protease